MLPLRSCLVDVGRMPLFMAEQVFLLMGEVWLMHNADTQCAVEGEGRPKGREEFLCLNFSCLAIKYESYFTGVMLIISKEDNAS